MYSIKTRSKPATANHSVRVVVSFVVFISVRHMVPHSLPPAPCAMPICRNAPSSPWVHLNPADRCHFGFGVSHVSSILLNYCNKGRTNPSHFLNWIPEPQSTGCARTSTPKPRVRVEPVRPSAVTAASTDKCALWHHHWHIWCCPCILLTDYKKKRTAELVNSRNTQETTGGKVHRNGPSRHNVMTSESFVEVDAVSLVVLREFNML